MKPSTSLNVFYDPTFTADVIEQMHRVADAGFFHIDMNFWDWSHDPISPFKQDNWRDWVKSIRIAAARMNLTFTQSHAHVYNFYEFPADNPHEEQILRSIEGTGMLGIKWVVLHPSFKANWYQSEDSMKEFYEDNIPYFRKLAAYAQKFNVGLALENVGYGGCHRMLTAEELCKLIDAVQMPNVGACWDTGHANLSQIKYPQADSIHTLGHRLHALHIADNFGTADDHMPPFFGNVDWPPIMAALRDVGYDGDFTFEDHNIVRRVPEACKADALRLTYRIGETLVNMSEEA